MNRRIAFSNQYAAISILWLAGLMIGMAFTYSIKASIASIDFGDIFMPASFASIALTTIAPICLVLFFGYTRLNYLIYIVLLVNGFLYGLCSMFLSHLSGNISWFTQLLFTFSQRCSSTLLVFLCSLLLCGWRKDRIPISLSIVAASVTVCFFDYFVISKLLFFIL